MPRQDASLKEQRDVYETKIKGLLPNREDWKRSWAPITRGSFGALLIALAFLLFPLIPAIGEKREKLVDAE